MDVKKLKKLWLTIGIISFLIVFELTSVAFSQEQLSIGWIETFDGGSSDKGHDIAIDSTNSIIVTGTSIDESVSNYMTIKYDNNGNQLWNKKYEDGTDAKSVAVDSDDNVIVTGRAFNGFTDAISTIKYDKNGVTQWNVFAGEEWRGEGVAIDSQDNVIVVGYYYVEDVMDQWDLVIVKYDENGNQIWNEVYDDMEGECAYDVAVDSNDDILVVGMSYDGSTRNLIVLKFDRNGNFLWQRSFNGGYTDEGHGICVDSLDNIIVCGFTTDNDYSHSLIIKYDSEGNKLWSTINQIDNQDEASSVAVNSQDNIFVTGWSFDGIARTLMTLAYDEDGNQLWEETYSGSPTYGSLVDVKGYGIAIDSMNNILIAGTISYIVPQNFSDFFSIKYVADGNEPNGSTDPIIQTYEIVADGISFQVTTESDVAISEPQFILEEMKLQINVNTPSDNDGFCDVAIPDELLGGPFTVLIDGETESNVQTSTDETRTWIHISYPAGKHQVEIIGSTVIPEFSSLAMIIGLIFVTTIMGIARKKFQKKIKKV